MFRFILLFSVLVNFGHCYLVLNPRRSNSLDVIENFNRSESASKAYPDHVDWRQNGYVGPVKDQGQCNACWAFAIVGTMESHARIHLGIKDALSEQFLIDCLDTANGCHAMSISGAYGAILSKLGGLLTESHYYPYEEKPRQCRWGRNNLLNSININNNRSLSTKLNHAGVDVVMAATHRIRRDEDEMAAIIAKIGPITAAINSQSMKNYKGNYIDEPTREQCSDDPAKMEHAVTIVGYNTYVDKGRKVDYWIIKNSWGESFGDNGYYYLVRGKNACGIANDVTYPEVDKP